MKYALGNMLNGAGGLNPDQLALDLQFAADKTLTARRGPTPVLTRASTGTFVGSNGLIQSAAVNAARFDHDPITGICRGLLIEESRTNQWSASEALGASPWNLINTTTLNSNNTTSPDGLTTADRFTVGSTTQEYGFFRNTFSFVSGTTYTISCFLKADQVTRVSIFSGNQATIAIDAYFDLTGNGSVTANALGTASIQRLANGWYRCVITGTSSASAITSIRIVAATAGNSRNYVGNSVDSFWAWGAQLEVGSFATSYIPTTTASVVRSADVCSITGENFTSFWNRFAGTCVIGVGSSLGSSPRFVSNLISARAVEIYGTTSIDFFEAAGAQEIRIISSATYPIKLGLAYAINDYQSSYNGLLGGSDTNTGGTIPNATELHIGNLGGTSNRLTGHIQFIRYYRKRLPNAKLQALTV